MAPTPDIKYLGYRKHRRVHDAHHKARLESAKKSLWNVRMMLRRLPKLSTKYKLNIAKACIDSTYLYGVEITCGKRQKAALASADEHPE